MVVVLARARGTRAAACAPLALHLRALHVRQHITLPRKRLLQSFQRRLLPRGRVFSSWPKGVPSASDAGDARAGRRASLRVAL